MTSSTSSSDRRTAPAVALLVAAALGGAGCAHGSPPGRTRPFELEPGVRPRVVVLPIENLSGGIASTKDLQVAVFYNPVLLRMRRGNRYLAIAAAVAAPMFFGNFALHYVVRYVYDWQHCVPRLSGLILFFVASFVVLTASLWVAEWRTRAKVAAPTGVFGYVWTAASWWLTFSFTAHLMLV